MKRTVIIVLLCFLAAASLIGGSAVLWAKGALRRPDVAAVKSPDSSLCTGEKVAIDCYEQFYKRIVADRGIKAAFEDLKTRYERDANVKAECHEITHAIGQAAVAKFDKVAEAYAQGDPFCWSGYYHGFMEALLWKSGRDHVIGSLNDFCRDVSGKATYGFDYYNCVHGLGHGLMGISDDELFSALKDCDLLVGSWEKQSCYSGVFMENVMAEAEAVDHQTNYLKPSEPIYPCNAVDAPYKQSCYLMQTSYMLKVFKQDFRKVFTECKKADVAYIDTCYQSLGRDASGSTVSDRDRTRAICLSGEDARQQTNCVIGAVKDFISYFHSDKQALGLCGSLPADLQKTCDETVTSYYKNF